MSARTFARTLFPVLALLLGVLLPWLLLEGVRAVLGGPQAETSLAYTLYAKALVDLPTREEDPVDATTRMIADPREIDRMLPAMKAAGLVLGNSPFTALKSDAAAMNADLGDCRVQKPKLRKVVGFLRSNLFNPFDQVTFQYDADRALPAELDEFLKRYAFRRVLHTSNEHGERRTLPVVDAPRKVLVAGDSIALGAMLDDGETLSSQLQARDRSRQFVNLGIAGVKAADVACALERAAERYRGRIDELVYVLCENDWMSSERNGDPDELVDWVDAFRTREGIGEVTLLYMPYLYNTAPELTRLRGHMLFGYPTWHDEKRRVLERARAAGFRTIDYLEVTDAERDRTGTQFATMALYVDHIHPSRTGVERLVSRMTEAPGGGALRRNAAAPAAP